MKKTIHIDKFEHTFPKDILIGDIARIIFVYMIIMIVISLARMYMTGFLEGLVVFVFAMCLFLGWLKTQHYLKYNYVILKKGHLVINKNKMTKSYKIKNIKRIEYVKYDRLIFSRLPQFIFYMNDGVKYHIDYNDKDENSAIAMQYILEEYKDNKKKITVIECKRNYIREILILAIAMLIVLTIKFFFS